MMVRDGFFFVGGELALDFLNTEAMRDGEPADLLSDQEALVRWLRAAEVDADPGSLAALKRLRAALRLVVTALADGRTPRRASLDAIDAELRRGRGRLALTRGDGNFAMTFETKTRDARYVLARAAATFLASADPARIRRCGGTNCILFFYDATKSGTRRWCSMAGCGNRMKAALHYQRQKDGR
jgi:predicted RNA-binding Zn ribbon-like protein